VGGPHPLDAGGLSERSTRRARASAVHARSADRYSLYAPHYSGYDIGLRAARAVE